MGYSKFFRRTRFILSAGYLLFGLLVLTFLRAGETSSWAETLNPEKNGQEDQKPEDRKPENAIQRMIVPKGFEIHLVASEPLVRQPVAIDYDNRGRLWVIQYLQYPNPAGLKRVQVDRYSRTKYDRIPEPPPRGPKGADRITILEDTDGDGCMDRAKDFVNGLNLATGFAFGHGGVFVLNVPYLLFYPDRNRDDVPDSDPEVLLSGFGMEDAHSVANSLMFGPDGWLYGCQGSTVTSTIRGIEFQQGVWRYHPVKREFELFCEGGGNSWGLDFDRTGRLFYSTNYGGHTLLHGVQGANYIKSFGKHGALHNPFAYGYFDHAPHKNFRGGHVTVGGVVYQGDSFPESFRGKYIAGDLLGHGVYWHDFQPKGSTVETVHGGELLVSKDSWFAPSDVMVGPDGAIHVADWHDARTAHPDPDADWDRTNGRIFRISATGTKPPTSLDLSKEPNDRLIELHDHRNQWYVRRARQELVRRFHSTGNQSIGQSLTKGSPEWQRLIKILRERTTQDEKETRALEALWTLYGIEAFDEPLADQLLNRPHAALRAWAIRFLGDGKSISDSMAHRLDKWAEREPEVSVRQQIACSAARFPARQAMPMINANINRDVDSQDPYLPLLWWWAVEKHSVSGREEVMKRFVRPSLWKSVLGRDFLLPRLVRRYAAEGSEEGRGAVLSLLKAAPTESDRYKLWASVLLGLQELPKGSLGTDRLEKVKTHPLSAMVLVDWEKQRESLVLLQLGILLGHRPAIEWAKEKALESKTDSSRRVALLGFLGELRDRSLIEPAFQIVSGNEAIEFRGAALRVLGAMDDPGVSTRLMERFATLSQGPLKPYLMDVILGRPGTAREWLIAVDQGKVPSSAAPIDQVRRIALFEDPQLNAMVSKHWGKLQGASREEKLAEVRRLNNDLRASVGDAATGKVLFQKHCSACHQIFGEGGKLGPDLTTANRMDRDFLLVSLVDPSSVIRKEYVSLIVQTTQGRILTGLPFARDASSVTLVDAKNEKTTVSTREIEEIKDSPVSLMPEDLYRQLKPQELRDLFAYLQSRR